MKRATTFLLVSMLAHPWVWCGPVRTAKEAKQISEQATNGVAVSARRVQLNAASCGWEVEIRMPSETRGWRCIVDCDTRMVRTKDRIPNPSRPGKRR
jgi:hypothetical protein